MNEHTFKRYDGQLNDLKDKVLQMGALVEKATRRSMNSLIKHDSRRAHKVIERDHAINDLEVEIDELTRIIFALNQPAAGDLRFLMTTIKIVTDLERMGDLAEAIAERMLETEDNPLIHVSSLQSLSELVMRQLKLVLDAFTSEDEFIAYQCIVKGNKVREMNRAMQREYLTYMLEDPRQITASLIATNISKNLERISAHCINIAEMLIYMVSGEDIRHKDIEEIAAIIGVANAAENTADDE